MSDLHDIAARLAFSGFTEQHKLLLNQFGPTLEQEMPRILDAFYANLRAWPQLAGMFDGPDRMASAARAQTAHWQTLFSGRFDAEYVASVRRIGVMHSRIGLDPRWYIGGYSFITQQLFELAARSSSRAFLPRSSAKAADLCAAINVAVMIDIDLAISCYIEENRANYDAKLIHLAEDFQRQVAGLVDQLSVASNELEANARSMGETTGQSSERAMAIASAAEQASAGVHTVASAAEELAASIQMIASQVQESNDTARRAVMGAKETDRVVRALDDAAERIGTLIGTIGHVAAKTNMLALNASIEAARAGNAGKAFEVVASEVKNLADQTARMTDEVEAQVREIQEATRAVVAGLTAIAGTIDQVAEISDVIAGAVNQQNNATAEISRNIQQTASAAHEVSVNVVRISQASESTSAAANQVFTSASSLSDQAVQLSAQVDRFIGQVQAA